MKYAEGPYREKGREGHLRREFGLTLEDFYGLLAFQSGVCSLHGGPETVRNKSGTIRNFSVDHDHATGEVRGLLCNRCNSILGEADVEFILKMLSYLKNPPYALYRTERQADLVSTLHVFWERWFPTAEEPPEEADEVWFKDRLRCKNVA